jgi:hypothetical protein
MSEKRHCAIDHLDVLLLAHRADPGVERLDLQLRIRKHRPIEWKLQWKAATGWTRLLTETQHAGV